MKKTMTLLALLLGLVFSAGAETIFSENMGTTGSSPTSITDWEANNKFQNINFYMSGSGEMRNTSASTTYSGASGSFNVRLLTDKDFQISGINTTKFSNLNLSFGVKKGANAAAALVVTCIDEDDPSNPVSLTYTNPSNTYWTLVSSSGAIPASESITIKFNNPSPYECRIDDVKLTGTPTTLSGSYDVGSGKPYATLALAITDLTTKGVSGAVTLNLTDPVYNLGSTPLSIGSITSTSATNTVTIKPATGITALITGDVAGALINLNGADFVTIDGANATTTPTPKALTISNSNTSGSVIVLDNTSENCTITNCNITGGALTGIKIGDAPNSIISKNKIYNLTGTGTNAVTGIYYVGKNSAMNASISNNMITLQPNTTKEIAGIRYEGDATNSMDLYYNSIFIGGTQSETDNSYAFLKSNAIVTLNAKNNIFYNARTNTTKAGSGKHYAVGYANTTATTLNQTNNLLRVIPASTTLALYLSDDKADLASWQSSGDANFDKDSRSCRWLSFEDSASGNLRYKRNTINSNVFNTGTVIDITTDFDGSQRPHYGTPDIGAYELPQSSDLSETTLPTVNTLAQNYPNPFNPETTIGFTLAKNATVNLTVYNTRGEVVKSLINKNLNAGFHSVNFNAVGLNSGVYVYKLTTPDNSITKKMILLK